jgi:dTDP-4-amino-4,6-dideoxygalactose transaminase
MVTTNDDELARKVRLLRDWGAERKYHHSVHAFNYRMEGLQGAVLNVKLKYLEGWNAARREWAAIYGAALADAGVVTPQAARGCTHVYHCYTIRSEHRDSLQAELAEAGIGTAIHYSIPAHLQQAYSDLGYRSGDFPQAEKAASEVLSLPMFPELGAERARAVARAVQQAQMSISSASA